MQNSARKIEEQIVHAHVRSRKSPGTDAGAVRQQRVKSGGLRVSGQIFQYLPGGVGPGHPGARGLVKSALGAPCGQSAQIQVRFSGMRVAVPLRVFDQLAEENSPQHMGKSAFTRFAHGEGEKIRHLDAGRLGDAGFGQPQKTLAAPASGQARGQTAGQQNVQTLPDGGLIGPVAERLDRAPRAQNGNAAHDAQTRIECPGGQFFAIVHPDFHSQSGGGFSGFASGLVQSPQNLRPGRRIDGVLAHGHGKPRTGDHTHAAAPGKKDFRPVPGRYSGPDHRTVRDVGIVSAVLLDGAFGRFVLQAAFQNGYVQPAAHRQRHIDASGRSACQQMKGCGLGGCGRGGAGGEACAQAHARQASTNLSASSGLEPKCRCVYEARQLCLR